MKRKADHRIIARCPNPKCRVTFLRLPSQLKEPETCSICLQTSLFIATTIDIKIGHVVKKPAKKIGK